MAAAVDGAVQQRRRAPPTAKGGGVQATGGRLNHHPLPPLLEMAMRMPLQTAVVTDICRQGGLENMQHFVGSMSICFIGVVLLVGFVHA
ncbi:Os10g0168100 [Oryza sativa Japonica Group]|uniref:Os10g0168100 protein n=2 Tax=Oryza sativa subsp. japonica TaxID=39947 RepID=Q8LM04_ORYSJ|nr:Unknown protein [Oryza sativa Japonica Group]AAP52308.1 hypothetical protein LOC_Os10g08640 [Oryza sativa Japonica Group]BAT10050.1 Os10g0168100 [Oryza sativa Japonica Group]